MKKKTKKTHSTTLIPAASSEIRYDRETRDYAVYLDGVLVGFAPSYSQAEELRLRELSKRLNLK